jgi:hypothetical protein
MGRVAEAEETSTELTLDRVSERCVIRVFLVLKDEFTP